MSLRLRPMTEPEFDRWRQRVLPAYASELEQSLRLSPDEAEGKAAEDLRALLPQGLATPEHWLWLVVDEAEERVGHLWMARVRLGSSPRAQVYDLEIDELHRGRGLGRDAMLLAEQEAAALGLTRVDLSVSSQNVVARALYRSLGYEETRVQMTKLLER